MSLQLALVASMALSGLVTPTLHSQEPSTPRQTIVAQTVPGVSTSAPSADRKSGSGARSGRVLVRELDVVVPPVGASDRVAPLAAALRTQAVGGVVVADRLVAPKRVESEVVKAAGFQTLGVTWPKQARPGDLGAQVRTRTDGRWSSWVDLKPGDNAPDAGTADAVRAERDGTDPVSIGNADAVQLAFTATATGGPRGLGLALVGSAERSVSDRAPASPADRAPASPADRTSGSVANLVGSVTDGGVTTSPASSAVPQAAGAPRVITRAQWGAPAQACAPDVASNLVGAAVHHTAGSNTYASVAQAEQQIRNDAGYHINALHWCDIGYNFIVDKWGNIYEGRANSLTRAVVGAHTGGFNTSTVGVSMLGTYNALPSAATQRAVAQIISWRLGAYGVGTQGSMTYHTEDGGAGVRYRNRNVVLPRIFGHRDVWFTACPGPGGYAALPRIRSMASTFGYAQRFTRARSVVKALYSDLLLRPADAVGLQHWSALLAGGASQSALVTALTRSPEYVRLRVRQGYQQVLGRAPDPGGLTALSREILAGRVRVDDVPRRLYTTAEFYRRSGGTSAGFVARLYQSSLARAATPAEVANSSASLTRYGSGKVANGVWFSMEAASWRSGAYYRLFLKRAADPAGRTHWARVMLAGGEGAVRSGLAGSTEYRLSSLRRFP